jgi:hypothetical protein
MSDDIYLKYGSALEDDWWLTTNTATTGVTGQAANLTLLLSKNGTTLVANTGVTITEVSSVSRPGLYHISASGTTSFMANTGVYSAQLYWTTNSLYAASKTYRVTSNGFPSGTTGSASFTATANDGRVTDGSAPLSGATIYVVTAAGAPYDQQTSDASGLWGPVFFNTDGTYTFYVYLAGYQSASGTITVSGSTATGPGEDEVLTAIASSSGLTLANLKTYGRFQIRGNIGSAADSMLTSAINDAVQDIARSHKWSWLMTDGMLTFRETYATGTLEFTTDSTTVTLTGGVWPTWIADGGKLLYQGIYYIVATRVDDTTILLEQPWSQGTVLGTGYVAYLNTYDLPDNCMIFGKVFPGMGWGWRPDPVSYSSLVEYMANNNFQAPNPGLFAIQNNQIVLWPAPSTTRNWPIVYYRRPAQLVNNTDEADWDPLQLTVLQRAIDYQLAIRYTTVMAGDAKTCHDNYLKALNLAVNNDRENAQRTGTGRAPRNISIADMRLPDAL